MYEAACSQKTPRKNSRKESNISIKKYHHRPTFGVRSGIRRRTPYVAPKKSHEPVKNAEPARRAPIAAAKPRVWATTNEAVFGVDLLFSAFASYSRTISGGKRRIGCIAEYEANAVARIKVKLAPCDALAMAVRMKRFVRADVERAIHVRTVKGLNRKLEAGQRMLGISQM